MTATNAQHRHREASPYSTVPPLRFAPSAPAQGQEARKMQENAWAIGAAALTFGQSAESAKLAAVVRELLKNIAPLGDMLRAENEQGHTHVPLKHAFTVQATYKFIGKLKPRHFPLDE